MYSNKTNIDMLTSLLVAHGIQEAVLCPGSRNAPISHNLCEAGLDCHAVTDERSAAFYALGIALAKQRPVALCVTSGSALLNAAPAVAEAYYRKAGIIVISADRPAERIGQLDGQTLPQAGAFGPMAVASVALPEPHDEVERQYCCRLINEALIKCADGPVQINVPISEPLFGFDRPALEPQRVIKRAETPISYGFIGEMLAYEVRRAKRPLVVMGQYPYSEKLGEVLEGLSSKVAVWSEPLSNIKGGCPFDEVLAYLGYEKAEYQPDCIIYAGETIVSKRAKEFLRHSPGAHTWAINADGEVHDTFGNLERVIKADAPMALGFLLSALDGNALCDEAKAFRKRWNSALLQAQHKLDREELPYSQALAVRTFEQVLAGTEMEVAVHYANSNSVRFGIKYAPHYIYVNRGVNGIEGSVSTAAGFSLATDKRVFCVTGDLSFFYDSNALWNSSLGGNLRILLLNNGGGEIFKGLKGLEDNVMHRQYVRGSHSTTAAGLCSSYSVGYRSCPNPASLVSSLSWLITSPSSRPLLLEIPL